MATVKAVSSKAGIGGAINYVSKAEKTESKLLSGIGCQPETAMQEMMLTKEVWGKTDGRAYKHFTQNFHRNENITHEQAHKIALELASKIPAWEGHEVLIATHKDREHIHTHFIVNSVNAENGKKLQWSKADLESMKQESDKLCEKHGLTVCEKGKTFEGASRTEPSTYTKEAYRIINQAHKIDSEGDLGHSEGKSDVKVESYVLDIKNAVLEAKSKALNRTEFVGMMISMGIKVNWTDERKYITFTDIAREEAGEKKCKIRHTRLEKIFNMDFSGESLEQAFKKNKQDWEKETAMQHQLPEQAFDDPSKLESKSVPVIEESIAKNPEIRKSNIQKSEKPHVEELERVPAPVPEAPKTPSEKKIEQIKALEQAYNDNFHERFMLEQQRKALRPFDRKKKQISEKIKGLDYESRIILQKLEPHGVEYISDIPKKIKELEAKIPQERAEMERARIKASKQQKATDISTKIAEMRAKSQKEKSVHGKSQERKNTHDIFR